MINVGGVLVNKKKVNWMKFIVVYKKTHLIKNTGVVLTVKDLREEKKLERCPVCYTDDLKKPLISGIKGDCNE